MAGVHSLQTKQRKSHWTALQRLQGAKKGKVPRQRWHCWHSWQCGLCNLQHPKDGRETESLSLRQLTASTDASSLFCPLPLYCHGSGATPTVESRCRPPPESG